MSSVDEEWARIKAAVEGIDIENLFSSIPPKIAFKRVSQAEIDAFYRMRAKIRRKEQVSKTEWKKFAEVLGLDNSSRHSK
jgi:hypothetical protein